MESSDQVSDTFVALQNAEQHDEIIKLINTLLPEWIVHITDEYAPEYKQLSKTWEELCNKLKVQKQYICIVKYLPLDVKELNDQYINAIADILVSKGYLLRRESELIICKNTGKAMLSKKMYEHFKRHNAFLPKKWSDISGLMEE